VLHGPLLYVVALVAAFVVAAVASPAGVSGAVLLLPFQVRVLGTPSPAVTPTNLLYNVVATPGAIYRYFKNGQRGGDLTRLLLIGTIPGVVVGSIVRVTLLPSPRAFDAVIAIVLIPLGASVLLSPVKPKEPRTPRVMSSAVVAVVSAVVGVVGGIYGIGGGSILAPLLVSSGRPVSEVAPATLTSTFLTSIAGVVTFAVLASSQRGSVAPDWGIGLVLGAGGLAGGYVGARMQPHLPELLIRRVLGVLVILIGIRYAWVAAG